MNIMIKAEVWQFENPTDENPIGYRNKLSEVQQVLHEGSGGTTGNHFVYTDGEKTIMGDYKVEIRLTPIEKQPEIKLSSPLL
jgi:hypothetical protein